MAIRGPQAEEAMMRMMQNYAPRGEGMSEPMRGDQGLGMAPPPQAGPPADLAGPQRIQMPPMHITGKPSMELSQGDRGEDVAALQQQLASAGYKIAVDGIFGPKTLRALQEFQRDNGLDVDGIAGRKTAAALSQYEGIEAPEMPEDSPADMAEDATEPMDYEDQEAAMSMPMEPGMSGDMSYADSFDDPSLPPLPDEAALEETDPVADSYDARTGMRHRGRS